MISEVKLSGAVCRLEQDDFPDNPRDWDNLGTMICFVRSEWVGDEHEFSDPDDFLLDLLRRLFPESVVERLEARAIEAPSDRARHDLYLSFIEKRAVILPVFMYEHSGKTINTTGFSCRWDSGQIGWIYATRERVLQEYGGKYFTEALRKKAEGVLRAEVEILDQCMQGDVWGYVIERNGETEDSCWGFYGQDYAWAEALRALLYTGGHLRALCDLYEVLENFYQTIPSFTAAVEYVVERADQDGMLAAEEYEEFMSALNLYKEKVKEVCPNL